MIYRSLLIVFTAQLSLLPPSPSSARDQAEAVRWRLFAEREQALLAKTASDKPGDHFGLPFLSCTPKSGHVTVEGEAKADIRAAMAKFMLADETPAIELFPNTVGDLNSLDVFFSYMDGWRYKFSLQADHRAVERFKRHGVVEFRFGDVMVHEEFKPGLASAAKFFDICAMPRR